MSRIAQTSAGFAVFCGLHPAAVAEAGGAHLRFLRGPVRLFPRVHAGK